MEAETQKRKNKNKAFKGNNSLFLFLANMLSLR